MIDTHCHLNFPDHFADINATLLKAKEADVQEMVVVGINEQSSHEALRLAKVYPNLYATAGWHPTEVSGFNPVWLEPISELLAHPQVVAVGEIGLDFHWDKSSKEDQFLALESQIELANEFDKPVIFHCREANQDLITFLKQDRLNVRFVLHCFSGSLEEAQEAMKLDAYFGFDGPITFPKSEASRQLIRFLPKERILIETDSPFLAPIPYRGKPNQPAFLRYVAEEVARCWQTNLEDAVAILDANARRFFGLTP